MKRSRFSSVILLALILLAAALFFVACDEPSSYTPYTFLKASESEDGYATVFIPDGGDLDIMVLSDPQTDYYEKYKVVGSPGNDKTYEFIEDFVKETDPDLVVINGDLVMMDVAVSQVPYFERYAEIFERLETPWTFAFGNHDCDALYSATDDAEDPDSQCTKAALISYLAGKYPHCLMNSDPACEDGYGNHFVNVRTETGKLVYTLCLFDCVYTSRLAEPQDVPTAGQVKWYADTINALSDGEYGEDRNSDEIVPSVIFNHIGIPEFKTAWEEAWNDGDPTEAYHYGHWLQGNYTSNYGNRPESEQIFAVAKELGSTKAIFMCHHHDNDFSVDYEGIRLTFGQHSGYSHSYRTTQSANGGGGVHSVDKWKDVDFSRIDDYGDERGGTRLILRADGTFDITPVYARDTLPNYAEKYYIDYDAVAQALESDPHFTSTVTRGTKRAWKL